MGAPILQRCCNSCSLCFAMFRAWRSQEKQMQLHKDNHDLGEIIVIAHRNIPKTGNGKWGWQNVSEYSQNWETANGGGQNVSCDFWGKTHYRVRLEGRRTVLGRVLNCSPIFLLCVSGKNNQNHGENKTFLPKWTLESSKKKGKAFAFATNSCETKKPWRR